MTDLGVVLGVDGGGTKTSTACIDVASLKTIGNAKTGSSNWNSVGVETTRESLREGILGSLAVANKSTLQVRGICLCMSGVDRPDDIKKVKDVILEILPSIQNEKIFVHNDAVAALTSGTNGVLSGLVLISGTGTIVYGYEKGGRSKRASGWGPLLGDEGSGFAIGQDILRAVTHAVDQRGPQTSLVSLVLKQLNMTEPTQLIPWAYAEKDYSWGKFAALAPLASEAARTGDQVALHILNVATDAMLLSITTVAHGLQLEEKSEFPLVFAGGNMTHSGSLLTSILKDKVLKRFPNAKITLPSIDPEVAAALLVTHNL